MLRYPVFWVPARFASLRICFSGTSAKQVALLASVTNIGHLCHLIPSQEILLCIGSEAFPHTRMVRSMVNSRHLGLTIKTQKLSGSQLILLGGKVLASAMSER